MNREHYIKITNTIKKNRRLETVIKTANLSVTFIIYILYVAMLLILLLSKDYRLIRIVLTTGISFVLLSIVRKIIDAPRPYALYDFEPIVKKDKSGESMPSRHVFSCFVIAMAFMYIDVSLGVIVMIDGILMAILRVIIGVHFPKDVIVGALIGIVSGIIGFYLI